MRGARRAILAVPLTLPEAPSRTLTVNIHLPPFFLTTPETTASTWISAAILATFLLVCFLALRRFLALAYCEEDTMVCFFFTAETTAASALPLCGPVKASTTTRFLAHAEEATRRRPS